MSVKSRIERLETRSKEADGSELAHKLEEAKARIARYHASLSTEQQVEIEAWEERRRQFYETHPLPLNEGQVGTFDCCA